MAEIPDREQLELKFARAIGRIQGKFKAEFLAAVGDPPDLSKVSDDLWHRMEQQLAKEILFMLLLLGAKSAYLHGADAKESIKMAESYAKSAARDISRRLVVSSREAVTKLRGTAITTKKDWLGKVNDVFSKKRVEGEARTETTRTVSTLGEQVKKKNGETDDGDTWIARHGPNMCPVCESLDQTKRKEWERIFPNGPPAHKRCQCEIRYVIRNPT